MNKFEVGDKVKIIRMDTKWSAYQKWLNKYIGKIGEIVKNESLVSDDDPYHDVEFLDGQVFSMKDEWLELVEKKKKEYWNGKMICTLSEGLYFTKGKIYDVRNGIMFDDSGTGYNMYGYDDGYSNPEEITKSAHEDGHYEFIEFKGFAGK